MHFPGDRIQSVQALLIGLIFHSIYLMPGVGSSNLCLAKAVRHRTSIFPISSKKPRTILSPLSMSDKFQGSRT